jgi:aldehyde:ferredoxin oxidoreductase
VEDVIERLGLDRQYTQQVVDFVSLLYERGELNKKDTDGLVLRRRAFWDTDIDNTVQLIERIAGREGDFARCLGEGWYPISKRFGVDPNEKMSICKGASTILDARKTKLGPAVFTNVTGPGVHHIHFFGYFPGLPVADIKANCENMGLSREEIDRALTAEEFSIGRITKHIEDYYAILNSLGSCAIPPQINAIYDIKLLAGCYSAVTGFETSPQELRRLGEKAWNLYKLLNVREGFSRKEDIIPAWWKATADSHAGDAGAPRLLDYWGKPVIKDRLEKMLDDYYHERGWDVKSGIPTKAKLAELELEEFAEVVPR